MAAERVKRLKDLADLLERLPASPDRDRVLSEVRSRAVDVDTGVVPRAMLPVREPAPPAALPKSATRHRPSSVTPTPLPLPAPAVELPHSAFARGASQDLAQALCADERLSLEDSPLPHSRAQGNRAVPAWMRGLHA